MVCLDGLNGVIKVVDQIMANKDANYDLQGVPKKKYSLKK